MKSAIFIPCRNWTHRERNILIFPLWTVCQNIGNITHCLTPEQLDSLGFEHQHDLKMMGFHGHHEAMLRWPRRPSTFLRCVVCTTQAWECSSWSKIQPWAGFIYPDHLNHYLFLSVAVFYRSWRSLFAQLTALPFVFSCFPYIHMKCFGSSRVHRVQRLVLQKNICISLVFKRKVNKIKQDEESWGEMLAPP